MPGARYTDWTHVRVYGDRAAAAAHVPYARKLLGYLTRQRELSGITTTVIDKRLGDGTCVRAEFIGSIPRITITTTPGGGENIVERPIDGFVVKPHAHGATPALDKSEALIMPAAKSAPFYFDKTTAPSGDPDYRWAPYAVDQAHQPEFPAPDALQHAGNVDWRNAKETLIVSWWGPNSRYFADDGDVSPKVYCKGRELFDLSTIDTTTYPDFAGYIDWRVYGAAIRKTAAGYRLLIAAMLYASAMVRKDVLVQVALRALPAAPPRQRSLPLPRAPRLEAFPSDDLKLLWSRARTADEIYNESDYAHPFVFNQSATQCKRVRPGWSATGAGAEAVMVEETIDCADLDAIAYDRAEHPTGIGTATNRVSVVIDTLERTGSYQVEPDYYIVPPPTTTVDGKIQAPFTDRDGFLRTGAATVSVTVTPQKIAVDYRDDEPVYAYWTADARSDTSVINGSRTLSAYDKGFSSLVNVGGTWAAGSSYTWHEDSHDTYTTALSHSSSVLAGRLTLPEETIEAYTTRARASSLTGDSVYHFERSCTDATLGDGSGTKDQTQTLVLDDLRVQRKLIPYFLDLRSGLVVTGIFAVSEHVSILSATATVAQTYDPATGTWGPAPSGVGDPGNAHTVSARIDTRVSVKGVALASTSATSAPVVTTPTLPAVLGAGSFFHVWGDPCSVPLDPPFLVAGHYSQRRSTDAEVQMSSSGSTREGPALPQADAATSSSGHGTYRPNPPSNMAPFIADDGRTGSVSIAWLAEYPFADATGKRVYGAWASYRNYVAVSMPWPAGDLSTPNRLHQVGNIKAGAFVPQELTVLTGQPAQTSFAPIWVLPPTAYFLPKTG